MSIRSDKLHLSHLVTHETKRRALLKFALVVALFAGYFGVIAYRYGVKEGIFVTAGTWSFFVLCTPIADAGFLLDFPLRLITRVRMLYSELAVWMIAILVNIWILAVNPEVYDTTKLLSLLHYIIEHPFPMWSIIVVSAIGTFLSVKFGDELIDTIRHHERDYYHRHKRRHRLWVMVFVFVLLLIIYNFLLRQLGVELPV
ncbi:hypothetical protein KC929_00050 [Patescibacteria group bacterium]|nr:hypothetical protein [Patescibacteria group bacterium]